MNVAVRCFSQSQPDDGNNKVAGAELLKELRGIKMKRIKLGDLLVQQQHLLSLLSEKGRLKRWQLNGFSDLEKTISLSVGQRLIQVTPDIHRKVLC